MVARPVKMVAKSTSDHTMSSVKENRMCTLDDAILTYTIKGLLD